MSREWPSMTSALPLSGENTEYPFFVSVDIQVFSSQVQLGLVFSPSDPKSKESWPQAVKGSTKNQLNKAEITWETVSRPPGKHGSHCSTKNQLNKAEITWETVSRPPGKHGTHCSTKNQLNKAEITWETVSRPPGKHGTQCSTKNQLNKAEITWETVSRPPGKHGSHSLAHNRYLWGILK